MWEVECRVGFTVSHGVMGKALDKVGIKIINYLAFTVQYSTVRTSIDDPTSSMNKLPGKDIN